MAWSVQYSTCSIPDKRTRELKRVKEVIKLVSRIYVERRESEALEAGSLLDELKGTQGFEGLEYLRILNRYDIQGFDRKMLEECSFLIFADPCTDMLIKDLPEADCILAVEYLPGQYDQRADAAEQCAGLLLGFRPIVRTAKIYLLYGDKKKIDSDLLRKFIVNPVECREARLDEYEALDINYAKPEDVQRLSGFCELDDTGLKDVMTKYNLAMNLEDLKCCRDFFKGEGREPSLTEIKVLDTYWSDHCRHTTFLTHINNIEIHDKRVNSAYERYLAVRKELNYPKNKPVTLMDIATIGAKFLRSKGMLPDLVVSEENNACTVRIKAKINGKDESWLLLFKNETHNHPTEIEPFGGAATCIGGAIRDPLSGRAYVYQAMRITGAANPFKDPMPGKLPQRAITTKAASGYSSYGNQIGVPTGLVNEIYHDGYAAKRLEVGAVIAAVPEENVVREKPMPGDCVLLLGGRTGRDGCGGATGSSVAHNSDSLETCGAEVQKGNAPEERKLQRLFRNPEFAGLIKRCNDFGAGGVSVAVGELAEGLDINLDLVPLKYSGLDGTEIAVSESQERMAVVVNKNDADKIIALAGNEDVQATVIAKVNDTGRMRMTWRGNEIVNLSRSFIDSNGAARHTNVSVSEADISSISFTLKDHEHSANGCKKSFAQRLESTLMDLNVCSQRGLCERFDSTVGAGSLIMPFGGKYQLTPAQVMAAKIPVETTNNIDTCSVMSWGFDPFMASASPYHGAYLAVTESLCKLVASGANLEKCWLTFQEYFGRPEHDPERWGLPFCALLGALDAQLDFGVAAIGGKDSMSGSFKTCDNKTLDVPPTLISFAVALSDTESIISPEFKSPGSHVILLRPEYKDGLPEKNSIQKIFNSIQKLISNKKVLSVSTPGFGGTASAIFKMCLGNNLGFKFNQDITQDEIFNKIHSSFILELNDENPADISCMGYVELGQVIEEPEIIFKHERLSLNDLNRVYSGTLENIFPVERKTGEKVITLPEANGNLVSAFYSHEAISKPRFLIPVFAGTNCEYETARAVERAEGIAEIFVVKTMTPDLMQSSAESFAARLDVSQALILPGGFSNGDEPDGSGKFIAIFLRSPAVRESLENLLSTRGGLLCGICNGFQALIKTGLLPFGRIVDPKELNEHSASLTFNRIGRHQSRIVHTKIIANHSPWLRKTQLGGVYSVPISHGEGRFICGTDLLKSIAEKGQVAAQYVDLEGKPSMNELYNPNGSIAAIECITSPDGRILGRMGHAERIGRNLYKNVEGNYEMHMFESACDYFRKL